MSAEERALYFPGMDDDAFTNYDLDQDGMFNDEEMAALRMRETLPSY